MSRAAAIAVAEIASYLGSHPEIDRVLLAMRGDDALRVHRDALQESQGSPC